MYSYRHAPDYTIVLVVRNVTNAQLYVNYNVARCVVCMMFVLQQLSYLLMSGEPAICTIWAHVPHSQQQALQQDLMRALQTQHSDLHQ